MSKTKLVILHPALCVGGVEKVLLTFLKLIDPSRYDITLVLRNRSDWDAIISPNIHVRFLFEEDPRKTNKLAYKVFKYSSIFIPGPLLRSWYQLGAFDIAISFHEPMIFFLNAVNARNKIAWIHADYHSIEFPPEVSELSKPNGLRARLINGRRRALHSQLSRVVCVSRTALAGFINRYPEVTNRSTCLNNPQDSSEILRLAQEGDPIIRRETMTFVTVGRMSQEKAFERVVQAVGKLRDAGYKLQLVMVGDGPHLPKIEHLVLKLNLENYVTTVGRKDNPYKYIASSDFLVISSKYEAYCTVACEAMILGVPVLTTRCAGMEEILGTPSAGLIFDSDLDSIFSAMRRVLDEPQLLSVLRERARLRSKAFEPSLTISEFYELIDGLG